MRAKVITLTQQKALKRFKSNTKYLGSKALSQALEDRTTSVRVITTATGKMENAMEKES